MDDDDDDVVAAVFSLFGMNRYTANSTPLFSHFTVCVDQYRGSMLTEGLGKNRVAFRAVPCFLLPFFLCLADLLSTGKDFVGVVVSHVLARRAGIFSRPALFFRLMDVFVRFSY